MQSGRLRWRIGAAYLQRSASGERQVTACSHMRYWKLILILILVWGYAYANEETTIVGMATRKYKDVSRKNWDENGPRPLTTAVWYPAADGAKATENIGTPYFDVGIVATAPSISKQSKQYPLILISHGTGGSAMQIMWLGYFLASHGYIAAAVNHHGNTGFESKPAAQGFLLYWERSKDMKTLLDQLLLDPLFGSRIDRNRIGAAGFSLGGYTVISVAGGKFNQEQYDSFCSSPERDFTCEPQPEFPQAHEEFGKLKKTNAVVQESLRHAGDSYRDDRIKAVFALAPALGGGFRREDLASITVPVQIIIGAGDSVTPLPSNAKRYADMIPGAKLIVLPGEITHYTFLAECTPEGKKAFPICKDSTGVDRAAVHRRVSELALKFFDEVWLTRRK